MDTGRLQLGVLLIEKLALRIPTIDGGWGILGSGEPAAKIAGPWAPLPKRRAACVCLVDKLL